MIESQPDIVFIAMGLNDSWMASDGQHPSDVGYEHMAEEMDAALARLAPAL